MNFLVNYNPKVIVVRKDIYQKIKQAYQLTPYQSAQFIVIGNKEANEDFENSLYLSDLWKRSVKSFKPFEVRNIFRLSKYLLLCYRMYMELLKKKLFKFDIN